MTDGVNLSTGIEWTARGIRSLRQLAAEHNLQEIEGHGPCIGGMLLQRLLCLGIKDGGETPDAFPAFVHALNVPFVLGMSLMRGSRSTAIRSARAALLKTASLM